MNQCLVSDAAKAIAAQTSQALLKLPLMKISHDINFHIQSCIFFLLKYFSKRFSLFIFRKRGREGEIEGENHLSCFLHAPDQEPDPQPRRCPDQESNQCSFILQYDAQPTEPHWSGWIIGYSCLTLHNWFTVITIDDIHLLRFSLSFSPHFFMFILFYLATTFPQHHQEIHFSTNSLNINIIWVFILGPLSFSIFFGALYPLWW